MTSRPSAADRAKAEAFVRETYDDDPAISRLWLETHRPKLVRQIAVAEMQKRQHEEYRREQQRLPAKQQRAA